MFTQYNPAIHFKNVTYTVNDTTILKNVTGSFPAGKITTIAGPSGAGKSTLIKLCNGLLSPTSGDIYIQGRSIREFDPIALRKMIGIALQHAPMINGTVYENIALPMKLAGKTLPEQEAVSYLQDVGLEPAYLHYDSKNLSGGQRQKVSIARTLVNRPNILLLDEITASLDPQSSKEIEELIVKINQTYQVTIIWITHHLHQAKTIGDYTWVLMDGQVVETGESSFLDKPKTEKVKQFVKGGLT